MNTTQLEQEIKNIEQKIEDVKSFKNLKLFSKVMIRDQIHTVVYNPGTLSYCVLYDKSGVLILTNFTSLDSVRNYFMRQKRVFGDVELVGERCIERLNKNLKDLQSDLEIRFKIINVCDATDGWYVIENNSGRFSKSLIDKDNVIFIKHDTVYLQYHKKMEDFDLRDYTYSFCACGNHKSKYLNVTCSRY